MMHRHRISATVSGLLLKILQDEEAKDLLRLQRQADAETIRQRKVVESPAHKRSLHETLFPTFSHWLHV
jgi:hypothetical protein